MKRGVIILTEIFDLNQQAEVGLLSYNGGRGDVCGSQVVLMSICFYTFAQSLDGYGQQILPEKSVITKSPLKWKFG